MLMRHVLLQKVWPGQKMFLGHDFGHIRGTDHLNENGSRVGGTGGEFTQPVTVLYRQGLNGILN